MGDDLLTQAEVAAILQVPVRTLETWRYRRSGPPFVRLGRHIRYKRSELDRWVDSQHANLVPIDTCLRPLRKLS